MAVNNSTIMGKVWLNGTNDFQQRIPNPTIHGIDATMRALFNPLNGDLYNQFVSTLINRIGMTRVKQQQFTNPLAVFKGNKLLYGSTIQEIAVKWIKAHSYNDESGAELLKLERPEAAVWYHSQNRQDKYPVSFAMEEVQRAFSDDLGLNAFLNAVVEAPINSDQYDEYRIMLELIGYYSANWGFYTHALDAMPNTEDAARSFLQELRTYGGMLAFPSTRYNAADIDIPVFADSKELVLITTPAVNAALDVQGLAPLFNVDKAEVQYRTVIVDEFPVPNMVALLTTEDFFVAHDTVYRIGSFWNEDNLTTKHYLHHWGVYSVSPFVPCVAFVVGGDSTSIPVVTQAVTGLAATSTQTKVSMGGTAPITLTLQGTLTASPATAEVPDSLTVAPDAASFEVSATRTTGSGDSAKTEDVQLFNTYVDRLGNLHVQRKGLQAGDIITVTATTSYLNPSGTTTPQTATITFEVE